MAMPDSALPLSWPTSILASSLPSGATVARARLIRILLGDPEMGVVAVDLDGKVMGPLSALGVRYQAQLVGVPVAAQSCRNREPVIEMLPFASMAS